MTDQIDIVISTTYRDGGSRAAEVAFQKLIQAQNQTAISAQKLAVAQNQSVVSAAKITTANNQAAISALRLQQATERAARPPGKGLAGFFADIKSQAMSAAGAMVGFSAALGAAALTAQSFKEAFAFKAELDATTASINIQLQGVRDSGQVWNEAAAYANKYKLTQEETTSTVQASIGILRNSQASIEDTFGVLQRLTVLAPGKSIADAAFSVRELASGDITSIAEQFNISRQKAYEMRDAIMAGGDTVAVLSGFLDNAGVSMDALKVRTEGAMGAMKDLAIAQEELKLAQAEFAQGPGLTILKGQIDLTRDATHLLSGDFTALGDAINNSGLGALNPLLGAIANYNNAVIEAGGNALAWAGLIKNTGDAATQATVGYNAAAQGAMAQADSSRLAAESSLQFAAGMNGAEIAARAMADGTDAASRATTEAEAAAQAASASLGELLTAELASADAAKAAEDKTRALALAQEQIANLGAAVFGGLMTAADAAALLARQYGITTGEAERLIEAQRRLALGADLRAKGRANTLELVPGGVGVDAPGRRGQGDDEILKRVNEVTTEITAVGVRGQNLRTAGTVAGGAKRASAEKSSADRIKEIAQQTADKLVAIDQKAAEARAKALQSLAATIGTTSADMVASQEANDLELVGASEDRLAELSAREAAEATARIASIEAVKEARAIADAGDAEQAQAVLEQRQQQISAQQSLDEEYAKRRAELAGDPAATEALKTQYDEATAALADATQVRIDLAAQEAAQRATALAEEKAAVTDAAAAQVAALGGTGAAADTATGKVKNLGDAIAAIPEHKVVTVEIVEQRSGGAPSEATRAAGSSTAPAAPSSSGGGGGSAKMAGGGVLTGVTSGPMTVTLGDNPGGVEAYAISATPISGKGRSSASAGHLRLAGGTSIGDDAAIRRLEEANKRAIIPSAARAAGGGGGSTKRAAEAAAKEEKAAKPAIADYTKAAKDNLDLLSETLKLRTVAQDPATWMPINDAVLESAARDADKVARRFADIAATYEGPVLENAKLYSDALGGTFSVISDGLETFDRLKGSEALDLASLRTFEQGALATIDAVGRLGAQAATIPEASVSALGNIASTLAVLPSLGLLGGGGGGSSTNVGGVNIAIYQQPGQDSQALVRQVMQAINTQQGTRR